MSVEIKNMVDVDVIETASGNEKLLVESNGLLKRLPSSNFSGGGGSGAGFDIVGKIASEFVPNNGELIELDSLVSTDMAVEQPTFDDLFPVALGPYNQSNVYLRNVTDLGYNLYGYYSQTNSAWAYDIEFGGMFMMGEELQTLGDFVDGPKITSSLTYAELKNAQNSRPLTALIEVPGKFLDSLPVYYQASINYSLFAAEIIQCSDEDLEEFGLPTSIRTNGCIILGLTFPGVILDDGDPMEGLAFNKEKVSLIILFESGTEEEPVLGCAWFYEGFEG